MTTKVVPTILTNSCPKFPLKDHGTNIFITGRANHEKKRTVPEGSKYCPICKEVKRIGLFNKTKSRKDGHDGYCSTCKNKYNKEYRDINQQMLFRITKENIKLINEISIIEGFGKSRIVNLALEKLRNGS